MSVELRDLTADRDFHGDPALSELLGERLLLVGFAVDEEEPAQSRGAPGELPRFVVEE